MHNELKVSPHFMSHAIPHSLPNAEHNRICKISLWLQVDYCARKLHSSLIHGEWNSLMAWTIYLLLSGDGDVPIRRISKSGSRESLAQWALNQIWSQLISLCADKKKEWTYQTFFGQRGNFFSEKLHSNYFASSWHGDFGDLFFASAGITCFTDA